MRLLAWLEAKKQEPERLWKLVSAGGGDLLPYKPLRSLGKAPLCVGGVCTLLHELVSRTFV